MRSIAPRGKLHTYEFNKMRVEKAKEEFEEHGLKHLVEVHHRDVCGKKALLLEEGNETTTTTTSTTTNTDALGNDKSDSVGDCNGQEDDGKGGFQLGQAVAHAIFLDLPEPWLAVPHAAHTIKPNGRICSYSPCMEQTQRTVAALRQHGFHSLTTVEARLQEYYLDDFVMKPPPTDLPTYLTDEVSSLEKERCVNGGVLPTNKDNGKKDMQDYVEKDTKQPANKKRKKILCARPFAQMRGHTAFLTFATAGNAHRPDPN